MVVVACGRGVTVVVHGQGGDGGDGAVGGCCQYGVEGVVVLTLVVVAENAGLRELKCCDYKLCLCLYSQHFKFL